MSFVTASALRRGSSMVLTAITPRYFRAREQQALEDALVESSLQSAPSEITVPEQLLLSADGTTLLGANRFTRAAFSQLCGWLCPGLFRVLRELLPDSPPPDIEAGRRLAVDTWNKLVQHNYPRLHRRSLFINNTTRVVEGTLGPGHVQLQNSVIYGMAKETAEGQRLEFKGAMLAGPRLSLWWCRREFMHVNIGQASWPCRIGVYIGNSEVDGVSVRGLPALFTPVGAAIAPYTQGGRMRHAGRNFKTRVAQIIGRALQNVEAQREVLFSSEEVLRSPLALSSTMSPAEREQYEAGLARAINGLGLPLATARLVSRDAITIGCRDEQAAELVDPSRIFRDRSLADVFAAMLRQSRRQEPSRREQLEQAAYRLLRGEMELTPVTV